MFTLIIDFDRRYIQAIELNRSKWSALFQPYMFFEGYRNYLQVDIVAANTDDLRSWKGWVESRLRQLTLMVMRLNSIGCLFLTVLTFYYKIFFGTFID